MRYAFKFHALYVMFLLIHLLYRLCTLTGVLFLLGAVVLWCVGLTGPALVWGSLGLVLTAGSAWLLVGRWLR